jgi:PST family polysaccharide transporter
MAVTSCAIGIFLVISAPELFRLGLGGKWDEAVLPFRVLVVYGITRSLYPDVLVPLGRASVSLWLGLLVVPFVVAGVLVGLRYGLPGVAVGVSATLGVSPILFIPFIAREAGFDCKTVLGTNLVILLSCGLTLGAGLSAQGYSQGAGGGITHAVAIGLLSCLTFIGVVLVLVPSLKEDLRGILSSMTLRRGVPALSEGSD